MRSRIETKKKKFFFNKQEQNKKIFFFIQGQYLTAVFYGFLTYYAFPETYHNNRLLSLLIGCFSAFAIAFGKSIELK